VRSSPALVNDATTLNVVSSRRLGYVLITVAAFVFCPDRSRDRFPPEVVVGFRTSQRMSDLMEDSFSDLLTAIQNNDLATETDDLVPVVALAETTNCAIELETPRWTAVGSRINSVDA
jgi:hypothetical protein